VGPLPPPPHRDQFRQLWQELLPIGRDPRTGGYRRYAWAPADLACREWFRDTADACGLAVEQDRNGNLWAWWGAPGPGAVVSGSHLDSVPDGGAYDGPLGVVSAFAALDLMRERGVTPSRPLAVVAFSDEEGARFGVACVGSRLLTGSLAPDRARALRDADGVTLAEAMERAGADPGGIGRDDEALSRIDAFVELHVEQGRALADLDAPMGLATSIWPHGRWRFDFAGEANHAGTTRLEDRRDPMLTFASTVLAARETARRAGALATFGKVRVEPGGTNAIPSAVTGWLDARAAEAEVLDGLVAAITQAAADRGGPDGVDVSAVAESVSPVAEFDKNLRDRIAARLGEVPLLATGAGHDAGVLAGQTATAMLFVRNPTGVSHSPAEFAEEPDCLAGVAALASVLTDLA
jgi:N-carbamoyl-L-amino-acid hydrolase